MPTINLSSSERYSEYPYEQLTSDDIQKDGFDFYMRNGLPATIANNTVFLYNMGSKNTSGTHWCCVAIHYPNIYYFDPFGTEILNGFPPTDLRVWGRSKGFKTIYASEPDIQHV